MVFGINDQTATPIGIQPSEAETIVDQIANLGREALEPPVTIDHAIVEFHRTSLLFVLVKESKIKPVHLRGKSLEHCYVRSGGTTRAASRQEVGALLLNSRNPRWEELRASTLLPPEDVLQKLDTAGIHRLLDRPAIEKAEELLIG